MKDETVKSCTHLDAIAGQPDPEPATLDGCVGCLADGRDDWVHLRLCLSCGYVGCCDSSPARHASGHAATQPHPVVRSFEPGETWRWCYTDQALG
jgi:uncharacterized UBP type Zn finger protein